MLEWLKQYWFIFSALVAIGIAWGALSSKVDALEQKISDRVTREQKVDQIAEGQSRLDERTTLMLQEQRQMREVLNEILQAAKKQK